MKTAHRPTRGSVSFIPPEAYGVGYIEHNLRECIEDLCRVIGPEAARGIVAEILLEQFSKRAR